MIKQLIKCIREYKKPTILTLVFMVLEAAIETFIPFITAEKLINYLQKAERLNLTIEMSYVWKIGLLLALMAFGSLACGGLAGLTSARASSGFAKNVRNDLFHKIQTFTFHNIDKFSAASLVTRTTTDVQNVQMAFMMVIRMAVRSPLMLIFSVIMAWSMGGWLAGTFAIVIPLLIFGLLMIAKHAMPAFRRVFKKYDVLNESIEENVRAMRAVKGFSREEYEKEKFGKASENICKDFTKAERIVALNTPLMNFCMYFNMVFILLIGSYLAITSGGESVNIGTISALLTYGVQILMSLMMLSMMYVMLTISAESARRICEVLNEEPDMTNCENPLTEIEDGSIDFENVSFKYDIHAKKYTLSGINVHIRSGMTVGIIGGTGSSKSSLVQLIPRLYDTTEGVVRLSGHDVKEYDLVSLRDSVAMVLQKNLLFSGTVRENLQWGNENATDEEISKACQLACADEFVLAHPEGYDRMIEQGGTNVSGGQKQRLCIARALLKKPKVLILDDSTSAVDMKTDAKIRAALKSYIPETTKIIIAQRIASIQDADLILVMDNGTIVAQGQHADLMQSCSIYREVYEQQTYGGENDAE